MKFFGAELETPEVLAKRTENAESVGISSLTFGRVICKNYEKFVCRLKPALQAELKTAILPTNHKKVLA